MTDETIIEEITHKLVAALQPESGVLAGGACIAQRACAARGQGGVGDEVENGQDAARRLVRHWIDMREWSSAISDRGYHDYNRLTT